MPPEELWWTNDLVLHTPPPATRAALEAVAVARAEAAAAVYARHAGVDGLFEETLRAIDAHVPLIARCRAEPDGPAIALLHLFPDRVHSCRLVDVAKHGTAVATVFDGPPSSADSSVVKLLRKGEANAASVRYIQAQVIRAVRNPKGAVHEVVVDILRVAALHRAPSSTINVKERIALHLASAAELYDLVSARVARSKTSASLMWHAVIADFIVAVAMAVPRLRLKMRRSREWSRHREWVCAALTADPDPSDVPRRAISKNTTYASQSVVLWRHFGQLAKKEVGRPFEVAGMHADALPRSPAELFGIQGLAQRDIKAQLNKVVAAKSAELSRVAAAALARAAFSVTPMSTAEHTLQLAMPTATVLVCGGCLTARPPGGVNIQLGAQGSANGRKVCTRCGAVDQMVRVRLNGCIVRDVVAVTRMCTDCGAVCHSAKAMPRVGVSTICKACVKAREAVSAKTPCEWCGKWRVGTVPIAITDDSAGGYMRVTGACPRHTRALRAMLTSLNRPHPLSVCAAAIACKAHRKGTRRRRFSQRKRDRSSHN